MSADICVVSGGDRQRLASPVNHKIYALRHGLDYRHECGPLGPLKNNYFFKLKAIEQILPRYDWVFWIDDDAFFTDLSVSLETLVSAHPADTLIILADGRVRPNSPWTAMNSGIMAVRNAPQTMEFLRRCLETDIEMVRAWWSPERFGMFTQGDQDVIVYQSAMPENAGKISVVPHLRLNARPYHYTERLDEHFICHFPGLPNKSEAIAAFARRFGVGPTLVPSEALIAFGSRPDIGSDFLPPERASFSQRAKRRAGRLIRRWLSP